MIVEGKYKFPNQFGEMEVINPYLTVIPVVREVDPLRMTINVEIVLSGESYKISADINPVSVNNLDYNPEQLIERVITRMQDFKVS
tara:strand:- start:308 stop:565 length:258 start_codon:yes stop_codon:yes gene_type:complete